MTKPQALELQKEIEALCDKHGIWVKVEHDKKYNQKPELRMIRMEVSIKVDK